MPLNASSQIQFSADRGKRRPGYSIIPPAEKKPETACAVCGGDRAKEIGIKAGYHLHRCLQCDFIFVAPLPDLQKLSGQYQHYAGNRDYYAKARKKRRRHLKRLVRVRGLLPKMGRFLDVGCNIGAAVEAARHLGYDATGIDIDPHSVSLADQLFPGNRFEVRAIEEYAAQEQPFDIVHSSEVIEHVPDIQAFVRALSQLLKPGGILYLTTPDAGHWRVPRDFLSWVTVCPPEHIHYFNRANLTHILARHGIEPVKYEWSLKPTLKFIGRKMKERE